MSAEKIGCLVLYLVLAMLAVTQQGSSVATLAVWALLILAVTHTIEMVIFYRLCQRAPGSLLGNLLQVFLFGYFHTVDMKAQA